MPAGFIHILSESPLKKNQALCWWWALAIFGVIAAAFYLPWGMDWQGYGTNDWDFSDVMHAVPAWTIIHFHQFPLWNPYVQGGESMIGNPQGPAPLSVTFLMSLLVGPVAGIKLGNCINAVIGMAGMYALLEYFDAVWIARILAAVILAINGTVVYHSSQGHFMWMMAMYWPWMLLFFLKALHQRLWIYAAAVMLSLQFWGGSLYQFTFGIMILGLLTACFALRDRKIGYLMRFAEMLAAFAVFCGPRLLTVMETLYHFPRVIGNEDAHVPANVFYYAFLGQDQINNHVAGLKVDEFSAYVGFIPVLLTAVLFLKLKEYWPYFVALLFSFEMALGNSPYSLIWPVFHMLGAGYAHFSTRSFLISVFLIAMMSGLSMSYLLRRWTLTWVTAIALAATLFVISNLFAVLSPIRHFSVTHARQAGEFQSENSFSQVELSEAQEFRYGNSSMMDELLSNTGISNGYEALPIMSHAHAKNASGYRGEFYLAEGRGQLQLVSWTPNAFDVKLQMQGNDMLVVNQNFDPGWKVSGHQVVNTNGLLGVPVTPQDQEIRFTYLPFNFVLGLILSLVGMMAIGWDILLTLRSKP